MSLRGIDIFLAAFLVRRKKLWCLSEKGKTFVLLLLTWYLTGKIAAFSCFICLRFWSLTESRTTRIFILPRPTPSPPPAELLRDASTALRC